MSEIRRQSIISSGIVYIGFAFGLLNTWLFAREGGFTLEQFGLTGLFVAISNIFFSLSQFGMTTYIYKFYPYYKDNLGKKDNDMLAISLVVALTGYCLVIIGGLVFQDLVVRKFGTNSPSLVTYYKWIFPFGLGLTLFSILEAYAWQLRQSVFTNFLREVLFRILTTLLILLSLTGIIRQYDIFIKIYSFTYLAVALTLVLFLITKSSFHLTFRFSRVTKKFSGKIITLSAFVYGGTIVYVLSSVFDTIIIASVLKDGLAMAAVYTVAQNMASIIQAPQRGIVSSSIAALSRAWKEKDMGRIARIYQRSSINQLVFALALFSLIWLNFTDGIATFHLQKKYADAQWVFLFIGLMRITDMGTGVSGQIISTSTQWRFDFITGIILLSLTLPLNYYLTYSFGIIGPAIANLIAITIYNTIRYLFLYKKYQLQPFNAKSLYIVLISAAAFIICHWLFREKQGFQWILLRSSTYLAVFIPLLWMMKITPDLEAVLTTLKKRFSKKD